MRRADLQSGVTGVRVEASSGLLLIAVPCPDDGSGVTDADYASAGCAA
jgi:hypothetical protein